jgi:hypothetical protein
MLEVMLFAAFLTFEAYPFAMDWSVFPAGDDGPVLVVRAVTGPRAIGYGKKIVVIRLS